jgi:cell pole-organizing protein PopZ
MSAEHAQREPTMEEILASIRRIISEEDKPEDGGDVLELKAPPAPTPPVETKPAPPPVEAKAPPPPEPKPAPPPPAPEPVAAKAPPPPVEEVEEPEVDPPRPIEEDLMIVEREPEPPPAPKPVAAAAPEPERKHSMQKAIVSDPVATKAAGALGKLMGSMMVSTGNTLDDVVREMMKPMLKEWLDANLPQLVESEVAKEIDRIRRMAG